MKKVIFGIGILALVFNTSCKKRRTCECVLTSTVNGVEAIDDNEIETTPYKLSKKKAVEWCEMKESKYEYQGYDGGTLYVVVEETKCTLVK